MAGIQPASCKRGDSVTREHDREAVEQQRRGGEEAAHRQSLAEAEDGEREHGEQRGAGADAREERPRPGGPRLRRERLEEEHRLEALAVDRDEGDDREHAERAARQRGLQAIVEEATASAPIRSSRAASS